MKNFQCAQCPRKFAFADGLYAHCYAKRHRYEPFFCGVCQRAFGSSYSLDQHRRDSPAHIAERRQECSLCYRSFRTVQGLHDHTAAYHKKKHRKLGVECLLCPKTFQSPSSIAHHLESGIHNINRHQVTAAVQALDIIPPISLSRRIEGPSPGASPPVIVQYFATPRAFNGFAYECHICHRTFRSISSLTTHLNSPAHDYNQFQCPKCAKRFKLISALVQHIESGCCGLAQIRQILGHFQKRIAGFSRALEF